jgi:hypothetical protein
VNSIQYSTHLVKHSAFALGAHIVARSAAYSVVPAVPAVDSHICDDEVAHYYHQYVDLSVELQHAAGLQSNQYEVGPCKAVEAHPVAVSTTQEVPVAPATAVSVSVQHGSTADKSLKLACCCLHKCPESSST